MDIYAIFRKALLTIVVLILVFGSRAAFKKFKRSARSNSASPALVAGLTRQSWDYESDLGVYVLRFQGDGTIQIGERSTANGWALDGHILKFGLEGAKHMGPVERNTKKLQGGYVLSEGETEIIERWEALPADGP